MKRVHIPLLIAALALAGLLLAGCEESAETATVESESDSTVEETSSYPATGDYLAYTLDGGVEVVVVEAEDPAGPIGYDPFVAASVNSSSGQIEVLLLDGIIIGTGGEGVDGGDVVVSVNMPNVEDTYTDADGESVKMLYGETFSFETDSGAAAYFNTGDGASSATVTTAAAAVGDEIEGTFDALLDGHTFTGAFRATREADDFFGDQVNIPDAIYALSACQAGVQGREEINVDTVDHSGQLNLDNCDVWYVVTPAAGNYDVTVTVSSGDLDLYTSMEADFGTTPDTSDTPGTVDETVSYPSLPSGTSIWIVVAGATAALSNYSLEVVTVP